MGTLYIKNVYGKTFAVSKTMFCYYLFLCYQSVKTENASNVQYCNNIDYFFISLSALIYEIYKICNTCILVYTVDCISFNRCPRVETVWSLCIYSFIGTTYPEYSNIFSNLTQSDVNTTAY